MHAIYSSWLVAFTILWPCSWKKSNQKKILRRAREMNNNKRRWKTSSKSKTIPNVCIAHRWIVAHSNFERIFGFLDCKSQRANTVWRILTRFYSLFKGREREKKKTKFNSNKTKDSLEIYAFLLEFMEQSKKTITALCWHSDWRCDCCAVFFFVLCSCSLANRRDWQIKMMIRGFFSWLRCDSNQNENTNCNFFIWYFALL